MPGAVPAKPLGQRMHHDVRAVRERLGEVGRGERGVHDQRQAVLACAILATASRSVTSRAGLDTVSQNRARVLAIDRLGEILRIVRVHELHRDAERGQDVVELRVGAAVEVAGGHDVVAGLREIDDRVEDPARAGRHAKAAHLRRPLEQRHALLQHVGRGIHQPGVDVAQFLEGEQIRRVLGVAEHDRSWCGRPAPRATVVVGSGCVPAVQAEGLEFHDNLSGVVRFRARGRCHNRVRRQARASTGRGIPLYESVLGLARRA